MTRDVLPPAVREAFEAGNKIEAIKRLRGITGLGLKEAKDWIDSYERGEAGALPSAEMSAGPSAKAGATFSKESMEILRSGSAIEAIKLVRESTGLGLAEAAKVVEAIRKEFAAGGSGSASLNFAAALRVAAAARSPADRQGAPGEVAASGSMAKWFFLIAIAAVAIAAALYY